MLYRDMTPAQRQEAYFRLQAARLTIEAQYNPSPKAITFALNREALIVNVARKAGDSWIRAI